MTTFNLTSFGRPAGKMKAPTTTNSLSRMRMTFVKRTQRQIESYRNSKPTHGTWFRQLEEMVDGQPCFIACLRNGPATLPLNADTKYLNIKSGEKLVEFFEAAIVACNNGDLDDELNATARKKKSM